VQDKTISKYPLISVALVTYNHREFIRETLESVLAQNYPNLEIIVSDDASTDDTLTIVEDFAKESKLTWKILKSDENKGITANHNKALLACTGKYIAWLGGDDLMLPGKLAKQVRLMEVEPECVICYHDLDVFQSETGESLRWYSEGDQPREGGLATLVKYGAINGGSSNMIRRSASPGFFEPRISTASDWLYYVQCLSGGGKMQYIDEVLGRYRRHRGNITSGTVRNPHLSQVQDHLFSCEVIQTTHPYLYREVNYRRSYLLRSLRWANGGVSYRYYLRAALAAAFLPKTCVGYLAALVGIRR
jgi:glycosyltransferase involved in cell wall biosynthesis